MAKEPNGSDEIWKHQLYKEGQGISRRKWKEITWNDKIIWNQKESGDTYLSQKPKKREYVKKANFKDRR